MNEEIKELRHYLGLSQDSFAKRLGVATTTVQHWEQGIARPSPMAMEKIARLVKQTKRESQKEKADAS